MLGVEPFETWHNGPKAGFVRIPSQCDVIRRNSKDRFIRTRIIHRPPSFVQNLLPVLGNDAVFVTWAKHERQSREGNIWKLPSSLTKRNKLRTRFLGCEFDMDLWASRDVDETISSFDKIVDRSRELTRGEQPRMFISVKSIIIVKPLNNGMNESTDVDLDAPDIPAEDNFFEATYSQLYKASAL